MTETSVEAGPVLVGERVRLRPMTRDDAEHIARWAADPEFARWQWGRSRKQGIEAAREFIGWFDQEGSRLLAIELLSVAGGGPSQGASIAGAQGPRTPGPPATPAVAPLHPHAGRVIGFANYRDLNVGDRKCEIGLGIGEPELWSQGLGRDALRALLRHLFEDLDLQRVALHVVATNDRAIASYKACGFELEGVERRSRRADDGTFHDMVAMAAIRGRERPAFDPRPVVLEGRHVHLEPLRMEHAAELFEAVREPEIWTYLSAPAPSLVADIERYIRDCLRAVVRGDSVSWVARRQPDGKVIGSTGFWSIVRRDRAVEIGGTMLSAEARRTAANTEAKYLQLRHAFDDLHAIRVWLKTDVRNERSRRAIERIGATLDGIIRNERILWNGRVRDACYYSVIDADWPEVRQRLEALLARR